MDKKYHSNAMIRFVRRRKWIVPVLVLVIVLLLIPLLGFQEGLSGGEEEPACKLVSSRGILKSCDVHLANPVSSSADLSAYDWNSNPIGYWSFCIWTKKTFCPIHSS
jgi:hypothetical protein